MGLLNTVVSKFIMTAGVAQEVYICPAIKTYAVIDLTLFKEDITADSVVSVAISTKSIPTSVTTVEYFVDNLKLIGNLNSAEISKIIIGAGERLYIKVISGPDVVARVSGVEEDNIKVLKAGRLAAGAVAAANTQYNIYSNTYANASYISASLTLFNKSATTIATVEGWVTSSLTPAISDKIFKLEIPINGTVIFENILLTPNESIFISSTLAGSEFFVNGMVVG